MKNREVCSHFWTCLMIFGQAATRTIRNGPNLVKSLQQELWIELTVGCVRFAIIMAVTMFYDVCCVLG
jgi:hypothetical protein